MSPKDDIKAIDSIARKVGLTKGQRRLLHREIHGRNLTYKEIMEEAKETKIMYPKK